MARRSEPNDVRSSELMMRRRALFALATLMVAAIVAGFALGGGRAEAQDVEAQAQQIERQLLCPQCTNKRLDVCELAICVDMRSLIRERLAAGDSADTILLFFSTRYGDRVLADLPKSGFNLVLFCWVGGSLLLVALLGGSGLWGMRRTAEAAAGTALDAAGEQWLDEQLTDDKPDGR